MLHVYSYIKNLIYYAISYDYRAQNCFTGKNYEKFKIWLFFKHSAYSWNHFTFTPASRRVDKRDPQNIVNTHFKWKKVLSYSERQWIPFPSSTRNHEFISLQELKTRWFVGLFSVIVLSKNPDDLFIKKRRSKHILKGVWKPYFNYSWLLICHLYPTSSKNSYCWI